LVKVYAYSPVDQDLRAEEKLVVKEGFSGVNKVADVNRDILERYARTQTTANMTKIIVQAIAFGSYQLLKPSQ
jgi:hypothetical protein